MLRTGDFLIKFNQPLAGEPTRTVVESQPEVISAPGSSLAIFPIGQNWAGMPYEAGKTHKLTAWLFGELYSSSLQEILAQLQGDINAPITINGHALLLVRDNTTLCWHIWTDRFGTLHAYHAPGALGTFSPAVAAASARRSLDWVGLAGFFAFGFFPGDRSHYEGVRILPPATHTTLDEHGHLLSCIRYWQWEYQPDVSRSFDDTVDAFAEIFHPLMHTGVAGRRFALPISGGLDSRSTVAALENITSSSDLYAFSYGYAKYSSEIRIAQQIAEARHLPFEKIVLQPYLFDQIQSITAALEGYQDITQCRQAAVATHLGLHADSVVAAHWGDVWFDSSGADPLTPTAELALKKFTKPGHVWLMQNLVNNNASQAYSDSQELIRALGDGYAQIVDTDFRLKAVKTDLWSTRWTTASLRAYQTGLFPFLPFYDTRIADFFSTVPCDYLPGRKLQIAYLKRYAPDLAGITWQVYDANLYRYQYFNTWQIPRRAIKKIWRTISRQRTPERNWEVQFLHPAGRAGLEHWLLAPGLKLHNLIPVQEIRSLLDDLFAKPNRETGYAASMLLTFSAWLEQYG